jgi:tryptophan synthase alpha chain
MSRIGSVFDALAASGKKALIPYITAGDPHADTTPAVMHALVEGGADLIELGIPFSDPMADGPVIRRRASGRWRAASAWRRCSRWCASSGRTTAARRSSSWATRIRSSATARASSPTRERASMASRGRLSARRVRRVRAAAARRGIDPIFLVAPTSTDARIATRSPRLDADTFTMSR